MALQKGDIVVVYFPFTNLRGRKKRPALVLATADDDGDFLLMMITSQQKEDGLSISLAQEQLTKPLAFQSYARVHKLFLLNNSLIEQERLSAIRQPLYREIIDTLFVLIR